MYLFSYEKSFFLIMSSLLRGAFSSHFRLFKAAPHDYCIVEKKRVKKNIYSSVSFKFSSITYSVGAISNLFLNILYLYHTHHLIYGVVSIILIWVISRTRENYLTINVIELLKIRVRVLSGIRTFFFWIILLQKLRRRYILTFLKILDWYVRCW